MEYCSSIGETLTSPWRRQLSQVKIEGSAWWCCVYILSRTSMSLLNHCASAWGVGLLEVIKNWGGGGT